MNSTTTPTNTSSSNIHELNTESKEERSILHCYSVTADVVEIPQASCCNSRLICPWYFCFYHAFL